MSESYNVLVVDDEEYIRKLVQKELSTHKRKKRQKLAIGLIEVGKTNSEICEIFKEKVNDFSESQTIYQLNKLRKQNTENKIFLLYNQLCVDSGLLEGNAKRYCTTLMTKMERMFPNVIE
ncbi:MAG: hypothetical protein R6U22_02770 [Desulfohalobiaceae bacterium]